MPFPRSPSSFPRVGTAASKIFNLHARGFDSDRHKANEPQSRSNLFFA